MDKLSHGPPRSSHGALETGRHQVLETADLSGDETDKSEGLRKVLSQKTYRMKEVYAANDLCELYVTGRTGASGKPSNLYCRICRRDLLVLTYGQYENLRLFHAASHFPHHQRMRLKMPRWRVLEFQGNPFTEDEFERQTKKILQAPLVVQDRQNLFAEDLVVDGAGVVRPKLPRFGKVSCFIVVLQLGDSY